MYLVAVAFATPNVATPATGPAVAFSHGFTSKVLTLSDTNVPTSPLARVIPPWINSPFHNEIHMLKNTHSHTYQYLNPYNTTLKSNNKYLAVCTITNCILKL